MAAHCRRSDMLWSVLALWALWTADLAIGQSDLVDSILNVTNLVCIPGTVQNVDKVRVTAYYPDGSVRNYSTLDAAAAAVPAHISLVPGSIILNIYIPGFNENENSSTTMRYVSDMTSVPSNRTLLVVDHSAYTGLINDNNPLGGIPVVNATTAALNVLASYTRAYCYVKPIADQVCLKLLTALVSAGVSPEQMAIGGHSLGGWMTSYAARCLYNREAKKFHYCAAMDLAGPGFTGKRFDAEACNSSQCLITNAGQYGSPAPGCKTNVVVNGGTSQPGCNSARCAHDFSVCFEPFCLHIDNASVVKATRAGGAVAGVAGWCFALPAGTYYADTTGLITDC